MQSNIDCIMDDLKDYPDSWIELYNNGDTSINLSDYSLGTDSLGVDMWKLPSQTLGSKNRIIIYADKVNKGRHAPFNLDTGKGSKVILWKNAGKEIIDQITIERKQPSPNIAYGRRIDGADEWGYMYEPTPDKTNCGRICDDILPDPVFSIPGQVVTSSKEFSLTLSMPEDSPQRGVQIRYTTDGSEPTTHSALYNTPIKIKNTTVVRAKAFHQNYLSPRSVAQSYIFLNRQMTLPVISIVTDKEHFYDTSKGIYKNPKKDWRRPINIEYFEEPESESQLNQLCETRIQGGASRDAQYKSLALYAHKRFGEKRFEYEFFPDQRPGQTNYKSLLLRNAGNDFDYLYMRDAIIQRTMASNTDLDWQAWRPAIIFINGTYTGMLNIRERSNSHNIYTNYDGLEDIDMVENWTELKEGTMDNFNAFTDFYNEHGHTWDEYNTLMDLDEYLNLMIMNLYYNNQDFPGNNFMMWRPREEGGRWRFIAKDTDFGMGLYGTQATYQTIKWLYDHNYDYNRNWANESKHTRLFRRLMEDEDFSREFIDRCAIYMGTFMNFDGTWKVWEPMYELIKTEYPTHRKLINQWWPNYNDEISSAKNWVRNRTSSFYSQLSSYYGLGNPTQLRINDKLSDIECEDISVRFNGITINDARFDGKFFANRQITLQGGPALDDNGTPKSARTVIGWTVSYNNVTNEYEGPLCQFMMPNSSMVTITAKIGQDDGLEEISQDIASESVVYDIYGRRTHDSSGLLMIHRSDNSSQKVLYK